MIEATTKREKPKPLPAEKIPFPDHVALMRLSTAGLSAGTVKQYSVRYRTGLALILDLDPSLAEMAPAERFDENLIGAVAAAFLQRMSLTSTDTAMRDLRKVYSHVLPDLDGAVFDTTLDRLRIALAEQGGEPEDMAPRRERFYALPLGAWPAADRAACNALVARRGRRGEALSGDWGRFLGVVAKEVPEALSLPLDRRLTTEAVAAYAAHTARESVQTDKTARLRSLKVAAAELSSTIETAAVDEHILELRQAARLTSPLAALGTPVLEAESEMLLTPAETETLNALTQGGADGHDDLAETTAVHCEYSYRSMLALAERAGLSINRNVAARDWPAILAALIAARPHWQASTRLARLIEIRAVLRRLPGPIDIAFLNDEIVAADTAARAQRKPLDVPDIDAADLLRDAVNLCRDAMRRYGDLSSSQNPYIDPGKMLERFRDGLVIALMTLAPLRVTNFSELVIDATFRKNEAGGYDIEIPAAGAKGRRRIVEEVPEILVRLVDFYLEVVRPRLGGEGSTAVWPNPDDGLPLSVSWFQRRVPELIRELTGRQLTDSKVTPHKLRAIAATTARAIGTNPNIGQIILSHADPATTRRFYGRMSDAKGREVMAMIARQALGQMIAESGLLTDP